MNNGFTCRRSNPLIILTVSDHIAYNAWTGLSARLGQSLEENGLLVQTFSVKWPSIIATRTSSELALAKSTSS